MFNQLKFCEATFNNMFAINFWDNSRRIFNYYIENLHNLRLSVTVRPILQTLLIDTFYQKIIFVLSLLQTFSPFK
jgi:hypothetical protein